MIVLESTDYIRVSYLAQFQTIYGKDLGARET